AGVLIDAPLFWARIVHARHIFEIAQCCRKLVQAAARRFQSVAGFVRCSLNLWCPGAELNHRHLHFQCSALPTELPRRRARRADEEKRGVYRGSIPGCPEQTATLVIHAPGVSSPGFAAGVPSSSSSSLTGTA